MKQIFFSLLFILAMGMFAVPSAYAADPQLTIRDTGYDATFISQSEPDPITIEAGQTKLVKIKFKNTGSKPWINEGNNYISAYTMEPRERASVFYGNGAGWNSKTQIGRMTGTVTPGDVGELGVVLHAPQQPGTYKEEFHLAAENWTWVEGGYFFLDIVVVPRSETVALEADTRVNTEVPTTTMHVAKRIGLSKKSVEVVGGDQVNVVAIYQNIGDTVWNGYRLAAGSAISLASLDDTYSFADHGWQSGNVIFSADEAVGPSSILRKEFTFRAPAQKGDYTFTAGLAVDGTALDQFSIDVHVTENAPLNYVAPAFDNALSHETIDPEVPRLSEEPRIRVGIKTEGTTLQFISYEDDYAVFDGTTQIGILPKQKIALLRYTDGVYSYDGPGLTTDVTQYVRLEPVNNPHAVFTLMNVSRPMSWVGPGDFNKYRGALEYRKGEKEEALYAVNDLLLDDYVKGMSETGKGDQFEFVKANLTAARTYAYISRGKYPFFDVLASTYDQLYLGYNVEVYNPQVPQAAEASRGRMVTYQDEVVTTPYFGNSGGYTKSWTSVWGGAEKPWLVPVTATYDLRDRKVQFGHGVGMSQRDANIRAKEEGIDYTALLKYYYTGVEVTLMYE